MTPRWWRTGEIHIFWIIIIYWIRIFIFSFLEHDNTLIREDIRFEDINDTEFYPTHNSTNTETPESVSR